MADENGNIGPLAGFKVKIKDSNNRNEKYIQAGATLGTNAVTFAGEWYYTDSANTTHYLNVDSTGAVSFSTTSPPQTWTATNNRLHTTISSTISSTTYYLTHGDTTLSSTTTAPTAGHTVAKESPAAAHNLAHYLGASMKPGAKLAVKLHVWPAWPNVGEFECKRLGHDSIEFRVNVQVARLPRLELDGSLRLGPMGRCIVTLGGVSDSDASYRRSGERLLVESKSFGNFKPSIEFWRAGEETKADVFVNLGPIRPKLHVAITPAMSAMADEWEQAIAAFSES